MASLTPSSQCKGERLFEMPRKDSLARRCLTTTATTHLLYSELGASQFSRNRSDHRPLYGCEAFLCFGTRRETILFLCLDFPKIKCKESMGDRHSDSEREWDGLAARVEKDNASTTPWADSGLRLMSFYWRPVERVILSWFVICGQIHEWII